jgi:ActR/RegA family two-component response regulator
MFFSEFWDHGGIGPVDSGRGSSFLVDRDNGFTFSEGRGGGSGGRGLERVDDDGETTEGVEMKSKKILIAYKDDFLVRSLSTHLHRVGYRVETARVVSEVIRKVRDGKIQVVLLEDEIEGVKACDLVSVFKKIDHRLQVIVISSEESIGGVKRLRGAGIFYQAMKPVDMGEIRSAVGCAFEKLEREDVKGGFFSFLIPELNPA